MPPIKLNEEWLSVLSDEFEKSYIKDLRQFILEQKKSGKVVFPENHKIFNALDSTPLSKVKVVILGQDPYHGPNQAHGLSFSVKKGVAIPPSLRNIYQELNQDIGCIIPNHGNLQSWANQGVLLLNSVLTVNQAQAGSHQNQGWEKFTDRIITELNKKHQHIVYMLWGAYAQKKGINIDNKNNLILKSVHPSPLSAYRGFLGCKHFSQCNNYLQANNQQSIDWQIKE